MFGQCLSLDYNSSILLVHSETSQESIRRDTWMNACLVARTLYSTIGIAPQDAQEEDANSFRRDD